MKTNIDNIIEKIEKESQEIGFNQTSDKLVGQFLATLCSSKPGGKFLELGTGSGLSTTWIAEGMDDDSVLITVDNDESLVNIAKQYLGQDTRITFIVAQGEDVIDSIEEDSLDFVFADTWPGKYTHLEETLKFLKMGGIYVIDDMLPQDNWPEGHSGKVKKLMRYLDKRADLEVTKMDWSTGVIVCTKRAIKTEETNQWNPKTYNKHTAFVSQLALPVVDLLDPKEGESILDVGCGEGTLAIEIERRGAKVIGVDMSPQMVTEAKNNSIEAYVGSVIDLPYDEVFDAVFSNAVLHWVKDARAAVQSIAKSLKCNGRFVCEFGGEGNAYHVVSAMQEVFAKHPEFCVFENPWYFPSVEEYRRLLESEGFRVEYIERIPRPTPIDDISNWLDIFANGITSHLTKTQFEIFRHECKEILKKTNYSKDEGWVVDYKRLRVKAVKKC